MPKIKSLSALQIFDSRGTPTVQVFLETTSGKISGACVPSGASKGKNEAFELRDGGKDFFGKGVSKAISNVEGEIFGALVGKNIFDQKEIDETLINLDGTENKSRLGANAILGVSIANLKAAAQEKNLEVFEYLNPAEKIIPTPFINMINGGAHADNNCGVQEFMIIPKGFKTFSKAIRASAEIFFQLKNILKNKNLSTNVGDEGGFAPELNSNEEAIELLLFAIEKSGYKPGEEVFLGLDVAANELEKNGNISLLKKNSCTISKKDLIEKYEEWVKKYPIISLEDPLPESDWEDWQALTKKLKNIQIVGDDIFVTQTKKLQKGIENNSANSILIKPNQVGTITETLDAISLAKKNNFKTIISHRSGDTEDAFIADFAVGTSAMQIKTGSLSRSERVAKYNRLLHIEKILGEKVHYIDY